MRTRVDWRSASRENYKDFCEKNPSIKLSWDAWKRIIYNFNESVRDYVLETGEKARLPYGFGEYSIIKKKRKRVVKIKDKEYINLPVDWPKTREKGKIIYNFNFHTEGYFFGWVWFKRSTRLKNVDLWYFRPTRTSSRLLAHYLKVDEKYQHIYRQWQT